MRGKRGMESEFLAWVLLALAALFISVATYIIISGKGTSILEYIKNLIRFGGS